LPKTILKVSLFGENSNESYDGAFIKLAQGSSMLRGKSSRVKDFKTVLRLVSILKSVTMGGKGASFFSNYPKLRDVIY